MDTLFQLWIFGRLFPCPRRAPHTVVFLVVSLPLSVYYYHSVRLGFPSGFTESRINRNPSIPPPHFWCLVTGSNRYEFLHRILSAACLPISPTKQMVLPLGLEPRVHKHRNLNPPRLPIPPQKHVTGNPEQLPVLLSCFADHKVLEQMTGLEPALSERKSEVLPITPHLHISDSPWKTA